MTLVALMGICLTLVLEDAMGVATSLDGKIQIDPALFKDIFLNDWTYQTLRDFLLEHPDWAESIAQFIVDNFDLQELLQHLTLEEIQQLCEMFPGMEQVLGPILLGMLGDLGDGTPDIEPEIAIPMAIAASQGAVDNGMLSETDPEIPLFSVDSTYHGPTYIRAHSMGDFNPNTRRFGAAPTFDGTGYVVAPSLFTAYAVNGDEPSTLTFHMNGLRHYGTLVGDVSAATYYDDEGVHKFEPDGENRVWLIDADEYRVSFYPEFDYSRAYIEDTYAFRNERKYRTFAKENYLAVPKSEQEMLKSYIEERGLTSPEHACEYLNANYDYAYQAMNCPDQEDIIDYFLNVKKAGTCTNFASALTMLSRAMGVPARFVQGFMSTLATTETNTITTKEAHAWTEVYVEGIGWKRLDATPSSKVKEEESAEVPNGKTEGKDPITNSGDELFSISTTSYNSQPLYLRSTSFGDYDTSKNSFALIDEEDVPPLSSLTFAKDHVSGSPSYINISYGEGFSPFGMLSANYGDLTYDPNEVKSASAYNGEAAFVPMGDSRFARLTSTYSQRYYNNVNFSGSKTDDSLYIPYLESHYPTTVPSAFSTAVNAYLATTGVTTPEQIAQSLFDKHIRIEKLSSVDMNDFLNVSHEGNNQMFATAMVMLCRARGYHARYVEGYYYDGNMISNNAVSISKNNIRYWVEVYYQGYGWKRFDPTPLVSGGDRTLAVRLQMEGLELEYDGQSHLPGLENIKVTASGYPSQYFPEFSDIYLRNGDYPVISYHPECESGFVEPGRYRIRAKFYIYDAWGNDVTSLYTKLDLSKFCTDCYVTITRSEESSFSGAGWSV